MKKWAGGTVMVFFGLFWCGLTLTFDFITLHGLIGQWRSRSFVAVPGNILASELTRGGETTRAHVQYEYFVDDRRYRSERVRYGQMETSSGRGAGQTVRDNPVGAERPVYYDPSDPTDAVLQPGLQGTSVFLFLFLAPFNAVTIGLIAGGCSLLRPPPRYGGARVMKQDDETQIWTDSSSPLGTTLAVVGFGGFLTTIPVALGYGFEPPLPVALGAWAFVLLLTAGALLWLRRNTARAPADLVVSPLRDTFCVARSQPPANIDWAGWRKWRKQPPEPILVPLRSVRDIVVREQSSADSEGSKTTYYLPTAVVADSASDAPRDLALGRWVTQRNAGAFCDWLRGELRRGSDPSAVASPGRDREPPSSATVH